MIVPTSCRYKFVKKSIVRWSRGPTWEVPIRDLIPMNYPMGRTLRKAFFARGDLRNREEWGGGGAGVLSGAHYAHERVGWGGDGGVAGSVEGV